MAGKTEKTDGNWLLRAVIFLGLVAVALISVAIYKENARKKQVQAEIDSLEKQAEQIRKENASLTDKIAYLGSGDFQEKEAKDKLNLQKPDESVVIIQPERSVDNPQEAKEDSRQQVVVKVSMPEKWWKYFFKY